MNVKTIEQAMREHLQTMPIPVLAAAARGVLDLNAAARDELASRGLDLQGEWIGFPQAALIHKAAPLSQHAAALQAMADDAVIGAAMGTLAEDDALKYTTAAKAMASNDAKRLRWTLEHSDTAQRETILAYVHPLRWHDLGCTPTYLERSLAEYLKKFGPGG